MLLCIYFTLTLHASHASTTSDLTNWNSHKHIPPTNSAKRVNKKININLIKCHEPAVAVIRDETYTSNKSIEWPSLLQKTVGQVEQTSPKTFILKQQSGLHILLYKIYYRSHNAWKECITWNCWSIVETTSRALKIHWTEFFTKKYALFS